MFLFCADLSCHIIPVITHVGCTIINSTGHNMQTAGVTSREEHRWWWRPDSLHQYFPPDRGQWSLRDLEGPSPTHLLLIVNCSLFAMSCSWFISHDTNTSTVTNLSAHFTEDLQSQYLQTLILNVMGCVLVCLFLCSWLHLRAIDSLKVQQPDEVTASIPITSLGELETWCFLEFWWAFFMVVAFSSRCYWLNSSPTSPWVCLGKTMKASVVASQWQSLAWCFLKAVVASIQYVPLVGSRFVLVKTCFLEQLSYRGSRKLHRSWHSSAATGTSQTTLL